MRSISPLPYVSGLWLLRPLLFVPRLDIEAYCQEYELEPRHDQSNQDPIYFRNRLRHELLPLLCEFNPRIKERLRRLVDIVTADEDLLANLQMEKWEEILLDSGSDWLRLDRERWLTLPLSLQRRTLRVAVAQLRPSLRDITFTPIEQARLLIEREETGGQISLPGGIILRLDYEQITITANPSLLPVNFPQLPMETSLTLPVPGQVELDNGWQLTADFLPTGDWLTIRNNPDPWQAFVDAEMAGSLIVRPRQPGERFQPLGMNGRSAKIKAVMVNGKINGLLRSQWPIIANDSHLVWLVGHQIDERMRVTAVTDQVVHLRCFLAS